ncbi:MAG: extracellular solute-binding protein [Propionibacteriaceae bacterium]|jgi:multiple sugar transport system substrate-binding protein|nr:extracellular solute-binding protein [Propionibacteriaceae bacterium]
MRTHRRIRVAAVGFLAAACLAALAGCGSTPSDSGTTGGAATGTTGSAGDVTLEFWDMAWGPTGTYDVKAQELVKKFEDQNPGIKVNYTLKTWDNWYQTFAQAVGANEAPDVSTGGGFQPFGLQQDADAIMPLNDLVDQWKTDGTIKDFKEGYMDYYLDSNGDYLAIPWATDIRVWFYRTDLLEKAGVGVPQTYEDLKKACDAVHALGSDTYGIADGGTPHWTFMQGIAYGAGMFDEQGNAALTAPRELEALNYISSMGQGGSGCINPTATTITQDEAIAMFDEGKAAFVMDSPSIGQRLSADTQKVAKVLPVLDDGQGHKLGLYFTNGIMAYKQAEERGHKDAVLKFIDYWSSVGGDLMLAGASGVSPRISIDANPDFDKAFLYRDSIKTWGPPIAQPLFTKAPAGFGAMNTIDGDSTMLDLERGLFSGQNVQTLVQNAQTKIQGFVDEGK